MSNQPIGLSWAEKYFTESDSTLASRSNGVKLSKVVVLPVLLAPGI